jgi:hypothetical protein
VDRTLQGLTYEDGSPPPLPARLRLLTTGKLLRAPPDAARSSGPPAPRGPVASHAARTRASLLGVRDASLPRSRRPSPLDRRVHPDTGGSAELANRINVARDILVAEMNRRTPTAS